MTHQSRSGQGSSCIKRKVRWALFSEFCPTYGHENITVQVPVNPKPRGSCSWRRIGTWRCHIRSGSKGDLTGANCSMTRGIFISINGYIRKSEVIHLQYTEDPEVATFSFKAYVKIETIQRSDRVPQRLDDALSPIACQESESQNRADTNHRQS